MKKFNRNTSIVLIVLFILVTSYAAVDLLSLPTEILEAIGVSENSMIEKAKSVAYTSYIVLVLDFFIVLLLIFMFSMNNVNHMAENIVYVEREKKADSDMQKETVQGFDIEEALHKCSAIANSGFENLKEKHSKLLGAVCNEVGASTGAVYETVTEDDKRLQKFVAGFAFYLPDSENLKYEFGEGLVGQVAKSGNEIVVSDDVPQGYIKVLSGLGEGSPNNLIILPIKEKEAVKGILELAGFKKFNQDEIDFLRKVSTYFYEKDEALVENEVEQEN